MAPKKAPSGVAFTGLMRAGKDYVCDTALPHHTKYSFSEPMYWLAQHFFGTTDRAADPNIRRFYQEIGQLGHGYSSMRPEEVPPPTAFAAVWKKLLQRYGCDITLCGTPELWSQFGEDPGFWVYLLQHKMAEDGCEKAAVTNVRFAHELAPLDRVGIPVYLVACSVQTRRERTEAVGEVWDPAALADVSEKFAHQCYLSFSPDRIIWNDHRPAPSRDFLTVEQFAEVCQ